MSDTRDPLAAFDDDIIDRVADRFELSSDELRDLVVRHQQQARTNPGVEDLVYEWRTQFHESPLLHQTPAAYYLRLREHVWDQFADALDISEVHLDALFDVHEEQARAVTGAEIKDGERLMVLTRE